MPEAVRAVVEAFVAEHHVEQPFVKRKRDRADPEALARRGAAAEGSDAMNDPENFLTRWSRRKRTAAAEPARAEGDDEREQRRSRRDARGARCGRRDTVAAAGRILVAAEPAFDLSTLPPIESITAETDIRAFLAPGVPAEMRLAALRRAWAADPKVRDFVGLERLRLRLPHPRRHPGLRPAGDDRRTAPGGGCGSSAPCSRSPRRPAPADTSGAGRREPDALTHRRNPRTRLRK